jgi:hypothetical protein
MLDPIQIKQDGPKGPPSMPPGIPPHFLHELMDLKEKVGRLEGMMEVLMNAKHHHCDCKDEK